MLLDEVFVGHPIPGAAVAAVEGQPERQLRRRQQLRALRHRLAGEGERGVLRALLVVGHHVEELDLQLAAQLAVERAAELSAKPAVQS